MNEKDQKAVDALKRSAEQLMAFAGTLDFSMLEMAKLGVCCRQSAGPVYNVDLKRCAEGLMGFAGSLDSMMVAMSNLREHCAQSARTLYSFAATIETRAQSTGATQPQTADKVDERRIAGRSKANLN